MDNAYILYNVPTFFSPFVLYLWLQNMTEEKSRSISYRLFVTCDNPKGVECGAIRKSKQHSNKVESEKKRKENQTQSLAIIKEDQKQMGIIGFTNT